ncbi:MAG: hypothetical protein JKY54_02030 [Flavobacteriales bacterium]|nr:hypothetical protein [Flavobacteriales bacterium]
MDLIPILIPNKKPLKTKKAPTFVEAFAVWTGPAFVSLKPLITVKYDEFYPVGETLLTPNVCFALGVAPGNWQVGR